MNRQYRSRYSGGLAVTRVKELGRILSRCAGQAAGGKDDAIRDDLRNRSAAEVFDDHLHLAGEHHFEEDIERNVSPDVVILERRGVFRGHEGTRKLARLLEEELPEAPYVYTNRLIEGRVAFLEWTAEAKHACVRDGADSFVIEDGWIVAQTIHYNVEAR